MKLYDVPPKIVDWYFRHIERNTAIMVIGALVGWVTDIRWIKVGFNTMLGIVFVCTLWDIVLAFMGKGLCKSPPERKGDCTGGTAT